MTTRGSRDLLTSESLQLLSTPFQTMLLPLCTALAGDGLHLRFWRHETTDLDVQPRCQMFMPSGWLSLRHEGNITSVGLHSDHLLQIFTGKYPFPEDSDLNVHLMVMKGKRPPKPADASNLGLSSTSWKVVEDCWNKKRDRRPEIQYVASRLRKPW